MKSRLLLLIQTHAHANALMDCIPHIQAHYDWIWVVYSPAVLADPAAVEKEFDQQIADLSKAARDCYTREDGAGGDAYKAKRDAAVLEKSAKVKDAWKALPTDQQVAAVNRLFKPFFDTIKADPSMKAGIYQCQDHFETAAHVEMQNSLKAAPAAKNFVAGEYVVAWPTSLPKNGTNGTKEVDSIAGQALTTANIALSQTTKSSAENVPTPSTGATSKVVDTPAPTVKIDKRTKEYKNRLRELSLMDLDLLGPIAFELGIKPSDPVAGKKDDLVQRILELENSTDVNAY
jgi:hypothetical protein